MVVTALEHFHFKLCGVFEEIGPESMELMIGNVLRAKEGQMGG